MEQVCWKGAVGLGWWSLSGSLPQAQGRLFDSGLRPPLRKTPLVGFRSQRQQLQPQLQLQMQVLGLLATHFAQDDTLWWVLVARDDNSECGDTPVVEGGGSMGARKMVSERIEKPCNHEMASNLEWRLRG